MSDIRLRTRTVSEIIDAAFALYRHDTGPYTVLMAFAITPQLIVNLLLQPNAGFGLGTAFVTLISIIVSAFTYTMGGAAIMKFGAAVYLGEDADIETALKAVIPRVGRILWATFMKGLLYFIGFLFFFVGEFYVAARFFAVTAAIVLEDTSAIQAFSRSTALSNGRKRHVLNTLILAWIIYVLLYACVLFAATVFKSPLLTIVLSSAYLVVAYPIFGLTTMLLYYDCRIRNEGFDIERMAASLGIDPGPAPGIAGATP
ncbi:MAG TPA: hypothetical protein VGI97_04800 [Gemmatimonadaceae bacterium]